MVDDFDGDSSGFGFVEGAGGVAVEGLPGFGVDFGFEGGLEAFVRVGGAEEVGVADEEAFFVVVGVDEPTGDFVGVAAFDLAGLGLEDVDTVDLDAELAVVAGQELNIGLAEDDEEVAGAGVFEFVGHVEVGVHAGLEHGQAAELVELGGAGLVVEGAGDEDVEIGIAGFAGGGDEVGPGDGAELGADEDPGPLLAGALALGVNALGTDEMPWPGLEGGEVDLVLLVRLLDPGGLEVFEDDLDEGPLAAEFGLLPLACFQRVDQLVVSIHPEGAVRGEALDGERPGHADLFLIFVGFVVEVFGIGLGGDGSIDLLLAGDALLPPLRVF